MSEAFNPDSHGFTPGLVPILLDPVSSTRAANGVPVQVRFDAIPARDRMGRYAHLAGIRFVGDGQWDTVAAQMTAAYTGYNQLGMLTNIQLRDGSDWKYIDGLDGRDLRDDQLFRTGSFVVADPTDLADDDQTDLTNEIDLMYVWARMDGARVARDGLIPLSEMRKPNAALEFTVGSAIPGAPAGVTWDGFTGGIDVYALVVYRDRPVSDAKWHLSTYSSDELAGRAPHAARLTEYLAVRHTPQDTGAQDNSDYGALTVQVGGTTVKSALSATECAKANDFVARLNPEHQGFADLDLGATPEVTFLLEPAADKGMMAHGSVSYRFTRSTHTTTRYLHRTWRAAKRSERMSVAQGAGIAPSAARKIARTKSGKAPSARLEGFLPHDILG